MVEWSLVASKVLLHLKLRTELFTDSPVVHPLGVDAQGRVKRAQEDKNDCSSPVHFSSLQSEMEVELM